MMEFHAKMMLQLVATTLTNGALATTNASTTMEPTHLATKVTLPTK